MVTGTIRTPTFTDEGSTPTPAGACSLASSSMSASASAMEMGSVRICAPSNFIFSVQEGLPAGRNLHFTDGKAQSRLSYKLGLSRRTNSRGGGTRTETSTLSGSDQTPGPRCPGHRPAAGQSAFHLIPGKEG